MKMFKRPKCLVQYFQELSAMVIEHSFVMASHASSIRLVHAKLREI